MRRVRANCGRRGFLFIAGRISRKPGLAASVASLAKRDELARPAETGCRLHAGCAWRFPSHIRRPRNAPDMAIHGGEVEKAFTMEMGMRVGIFFEDAEHGLGDAPVFGVARPGGDALGQRRRASKQAMPVLTPKPLARRLAAMTMPSPRRPPPTHNGCPATRDGARFRNWRRKLSPSTCRCGLECGRLTFLSPI